MTKWIEHDSKCFEIFSQLELKDKKFEYQDFPWDPNAYQEDEYYYYDCFCKKGTIVHHRNYITGLGSDNYISCSCKECAKKLKTLYNI